MSNLFALRNKINIDTSNVTIRTNNIGFLLISRNGSERPIGGLIELLDRLYQGKQPQGSKLHILNEQLRIPLQTGKIDELNKLCEGMYKFTTVTQEKYDKIYIIIDFESFNSLKVLGMVKCGKVSYDSHIREMIVNSRDLLINPEKLGILCCSGFIDATIKSDEIFYKFSSISHVATYCGTFWHVSVICGIYVGDDSLTDEVISQPLHYNGNSIITERTWELSHMLSL